jgi:hypothetical protein
MSLLTKNCVGGEKMLLSLDTKAAIILAVWNDGNHP